MTENSNQITLPRYEQIKLGILDHIKRNGLKPSDRIPTEAELCRAYGWSRQTIGRAMNELEMEGVLTRIRGSGTYVAEKKQPSRPWRIMVCDINLKEKGDYHGPIFAGIRQAAGESKLDVACFHDSLIPQASDIVNLDADGILIHSPNLEDIPTLMRLKETGKPFVVMAIRSRFGGITTVSTDNITGMKQAVKYLIEKGHKRIAFVSQGLTSGDVQDRIAGLNQAGFEAGIPIDPSCMLVFERNYGLQVLESWFDSLSVKPTAIICSAMLAFPIQQMLWNRKLRIPNDVSMIVTDDSELFRNCEPRLTVLSQPLFEMGARSVAKLLKMLRDEDNGQSEILPMELIVRESVVPPSASVNEKSIFTVQ
jgi:GntR family transcriptional regulator of arabinose operon